MARTREPTSLGRLATAMPRGTRLVDGDGGLGAIVDRGGVTHARLWWRGGELERLIVGEVGAWTIVGGERVPHPLFGPAHPVWVTADEPDDGVPALPPATWMGAVDWSRPARIPPILAPGRLGAGAGTMILNVIAVLAASGGVEGLVYAGPYPTTALWRSLLQSFRTDETVEDVFTADALGRALRVDLEPVGVAFRPAPFERVRVSSRVVVQLRDGLERVTIDGASYDRGGGARRLVAIDSARWAAELWLGDRAWGRVAELDDDGGVMAGPTALPRVAEVGAGALATMIGQALPPAMCAALAEVVAELVAAPLAEAARAELVAARVQWGDPGAAEVIDRDGALIVHAGLWAHLAPHGMAAVARGLALALTAPIAARAQARLAASLATS